MKELVVYGFRETIWNASNTRVLRYQQEIKHTGLYDVKVIAATDVQILNPDPAPWRKKRNELLMRTKEQL